MKINFRIFLITFLFFFGFFTNNTFANQNNGCTGFNCKSEITQPKSDGSLEGINDLVISSDENLKSEGNIKVFNNFNFDRLDTKGIVYNYVNNKGEGILFYNDGMSCNLNTKNCTKPLYSTSGTPKIFNTNDYIVFLNNYIYIYNKKNHKFLTLSHNIHYNIEGSDKTFMYNEALGFSNFEVRGNQLIFLKSFGFESFTKSNNKGEVRFIIDFSKLKDEDFNNNKIYFFYSNSEKNKIVTNVNDNTNYYGDNLTPLSIKSLDNLDLFMGFEKNKDLYKNETLSGISLKFNLIKDLDYDITETLKNLLPIYDGNIYYVGKGFTFYTSGKNKVGSNQIAISYDNNGILQTRFLELGGYGVLKAFTSFDILGLYYNPNDKKNYVSFLEDRAFSSPKFITLRFPEKDFVTLKNVEVFENSFYLGNLSKLHIYTDNSILKLPFQKNLSFPPFFVSRDGDDLHFYYIGNSGRDLYKTNQPVVSGKDNPGLTFNFSGNNFNESGEVFEKDKDGKVIDQDYIKEQEKKEAEEYKKKEKLDNQYGFLTSQIEGLTTFLNLFVITFPDNYDSNLKVPFLKPTVVNGQPKIQYKEYETQLNPIEDKLKISLIGESPEYMKKGLSILLSLIYISARVGIIFLNLIFFVYIYKFLNSVMRLILGNFFNYSGGNVWAFAGTIGFFGVFFGFSALIIGHINIFTPFFDLMINFLNLLFGFLTSNFLDYQTFYGFTNFIGLGLLGILSAYLVVKALKTYGKIN